MFNQDYVKMFNHKVDITCNIYIKS